MIERRVRGQERGSHTGMHHVLEGWKTTVMKLTMLIQYARYQKLEMWLDVVGA